VVVVGDQSPVQYDNACHTVTNAELDTLEVFYNEPFAGPNVTARRQALAEYVFSK
jgi:hypothetical protein